MAKRNDDVLLAALVSCGSIRAAAKVANISETTIRTRLNDPAFRERYDTAKAAILNEACDAVSSRLTAAADTLHDIMGNTENPASVRTSAADSLLRHGLRYIEAANILHRLDALERAQEGAKL